MKIYDLCCCAGGASAGLAAAFPDAMIVGIDIECHPNYPFKFVQADVTYLNSPGYMDIRDGDWFWASPPCQRYSNGAAKWGTQNDHPHLIPTVRNILKAMNKPYCIENIMQAREHLIDPIMLCGTQFNLGVFRHRLFETNFKVIEPTHTHHIGKIGDGRYHTVTGHAGG